MASLDGVAFSKTIHPAPNQIHQVVSERTEIWKGIKQMKTDRSNKDCLIQICSFCEYKYKEKYRNHPNRYTIDEGFGKEPFKAGVYQFIYMEERDYGPDATRQSTVYACPKCGILQIENETNY